MTDTVIREVAERVWTFSKPFARFGFLPIGGRSTAIQLQNGDVWIFVSTTLDQETKAKLTELGPVKYLIAPDSVHNLYIPEFKKEFASAKCIGVEPLVQKLKGIKFDGVYGVDPPDTKYGYEPEITACYFSGFSNKDVAFLHAPSKTLIQADLLFNLPPTEQYSKSKSSATLFGLAFGPDSTFHKRFATLASSDKAAMKRDANTVASWDFERIIPCHGDVIEKDGKRAWLAAYEWVLKG